MIFKLDDTSKVESLYEGWQDTLIFSCLQKVMGAIYVTDPENPRSALAFVGCFGFFAGEPDRELVLGKPDGFAILVPQNEKWAALIEECFPCAKRITRYAIKKYAHFETAALQQMVSRLPEGYELRAIDAELYDRCLENPATRDFVSSFESKEKFLELGRGVVILKDGKIVSGASSYTRYREGIEIEVDTIEPERRQHLATVACAALILRCLGEGLYPSWDAQNMNSVHLAEKLGYEFDHEYVAYEVDSSENEGRPFVLTRGLQNGPVIQSGDSPVTTVYLVRHGTTAWNKALRYQGRTDNPLDEEGERQGACLEGYFKDIPIDLGVTSPLQRARKTLQYCLTSQDHEVPVIVEPEVTEMDFGEVDGLNAQAVQARYPEFYRMYICDEDRGHSQAPGGESLEEVYYRMRDAILRIAEEHPGKTIVIASHGTAIQSFLNFAYGIPALEAKRILLFNVCVSCVEIDSEGKVTVKFVGDKHHVPEELQFSYGPAPKR